MKKKGILRFIMVLCLATAGLAALLGLLAGAQEQVYAASSQPVIGQPMSGDGVSHLAPPPGPARAPASSPPPAPLSQGSGHSVVTVCVPSGCDYTSVQEAVGAVAADGIVKVAQGVYTDDNGDDVVVEITKTLTLQGGYTTTDWTVPNPEAHRTELNGLGIAQVISITAGVSPTVEGFHVYNGKAERGGGIYVAGGSPTLRRNRIHSNTANLRGGGIYIAAGSPVVQNNLIYLNRSNNQTQDAHGGGVYVAGGMPLLQYNTFYSNTAKTNGGGIYIAYASAPVISATIVVSNAAPNGGGGLFVATSSPPTLGYNDVWGNEVGGNYIGEGAGSIFTSTNPLFEDPARENFRLQAGSPCIDQVPITQTVGLDYEGRARPFGEKFDIGAHEAYTGTCFAYLGTGWVYTTVQAAVNAAGSGDTVMVAGYCAGVEVRGGLSQTVYISQGLTLQGGYMVTNWSAPDADLYPTILDAQGQGRVVYVNSTAPVVVEGFHVRNSLITGTSSANGGGFYLGGGEHVVRDNEIYSNTANSSGGGVYINSDSSAHVYGNEIYSNTAGGVNVDYGGGGGIYVGNSDALVYTNSVRSNVSTGTNDGGGGICVRASATVWDNTVYDNRSDYDGGGIYVRETAATVQRNRVYENTASHDGGGVCVDAPFGAVAIVEYNEIYSNTAQGSGGGSGGGGIFTLGSTSSSSGPTVRHNTVNSNTTSSSDGGGIRVRNYSLVWGNTIYGNSADDGGGVAVTMGDADDPAPVIERNRILGNNASDKGGGIWAGINCQVIIENNLIYGNAGGDGIYLESGALVQNNTIYGNTGNGIHRHWGGGVLPTIRNNIIVSNTQHGVSCGSSNHITATYCDVWGNALGGYDGNAFAGTGTITESPQFVNPGVPGMDLHLQFASPCKDGADPDNYADGDYDGVDRPIGLRADMGAYEYYSGVCFARVGSGPIYATVQAAVDAITQTDIVKVAGVCQGAFARTVGGDIFTQTVYISQPLMLRGGYTVTDWTNPTTQAILDAGGQGRVVYITGTSAVTVDGFIIQGGVAITGGGLYVATPLSPTIQNIVFYNNSADYGGGFGSAGGNPRLYNNTFVTNTSTGGGGLHVAAGGLAISNTIIAQNTGDSLSTNVPITLYYCDVWGNSGCDWCTNVFTVAGSFSADPLLGAGFHLPADSPCVHRGDPGTGLTLDFEGDARPLPEGGWYDIGADESTFYPDVDFGPSESTLPGIPGELVVHTHFLTNTSSVGDVFDLNHELITSGLGTGWIVDYTPVFTLAAGEWDQVPVTVHVPDDAISNTYAIVTITARSRLNDAVYDVVANTTLVNWSPGVELTPEYAEQVNPGTVMTYVHTLANTGNAPDTYKIGWSSNYPAWVVVTPTQNVTVGARMTTTLWVKVDVPATAPGGLVAMVVVSASSTNPAASDVWAVVTDTTEVNYTTGPRYVATSGEDELNNCLVRQAACATIVRAVGQAASGDTVMVAVGTYNECDIYLNKDITLRGGYRSDFKKFDPLIYPTIVDAEGKGRVFYIFGSPRVEGFIIQGGSTPGSGGGVYVDVGSPVLWRNVITNNVASEDGGGLFNNRGNPTLERNVLAWNTANRGGGFASSSGDPSFWNNLVHKNSASESGGGVYVAGGSPRIWHDTIYSNTADRGGGLYLAGGSSVVSNTIVVSNTALIAGGGIYKGGGTPALDYNDVWSNGGGNYGGGISAGSQSTSTNPLFVDVAGGDFHLRADSPCIELGGATEVEEDFDGQARWMSDWPDIGADEFRRAGVELTPGYSESTLPDVTVTYDHLVTNTGNYTDTFAVSAAMLNQTDWGAGVVPDEVTLGPGDAEEIVVSVKPSPDAISGTVGRTAVIAFSSDTGVSAQAIDTTTVGLSRGVDLLPDEILMIKTASSEYHTVLVTYTHLLVNTGSGQETFNLEGVSSEGWAVDVNPPQVTLGARTSTTVQVFVSVPHLAPSCANLRVDSTIITVTSDDGNISDSGLDLTVVNQCAGLSLDPDHRSGIGAPGGDSVVYTHTLTNEGNWGDTFYLFAGGWADIKGSDEIDLTYGGSTVIEVEVTVPTDPAPPCNTIHTDFITVVSTFDSFGSYARGTMTETTFVIGLPSAEVGPDGTQSLASNPSEPLTITYSHRLTNTSNCTYTFDLEAGSSLGFDVKVTPTQVADLEAGDSMTLTVVVTVPAMAPICTNQLVDTTIVTVTESSVVLGNAIDTTSINECGVDLLPSHQSYAEPGTVITYVHTLHNIGIVSDSYFITSTCVWTTTVAPTAVYTLPPGDFITVTVAVSVPAGLYSGTVETAFITATSQITDVIFDRVTDETIVAYVPGAEITPDGSDEVAPGGIVTYTHILTNTGNYTETFDLTTASEFGYAEVKSPVGLVVLGPGESYTQVVVTVQIPDHVASGDVGQTDVIVSFADERVVANDYTVVAFIAGTRYVAPGGTDDNNCTLPYDFGACATVQHAVIQAIDGDEVRVAQGVYTDVNSTNGYTQVVYLDESLILRGGYTVGDWDTSDPESRWTVMDAGGQGRVVVVVGQDINPTIEGFHLRGGYVDGNGAGLYIPAGAVPTVQLNLIYSNTAQDGYGGGVYYGGGGGVPVLQRNTVYSNAADYGAGFYVDAGVPRVWNNVVYRNEAVVSGGGLYNANGSPLVWNNTFYSNTALTGGGIFLSSGSPAVSNTIVVNNANYGICGSAGTLAYNDVWGNSPSDYSPARTGTGSISDDPRFVGATSGDFHLRSDSPVIEAGQPNVAQPDMDRDGNPRPLPQSGRHDMGAYENGLASVKTVVGVAPPGEVITYTIAVTNSGDVLRTVSVTDTLHHYLDYTGLGFTTGDGEYISDEHTISWTGPVYTATPTLITFTAQITDWLVAGTFITNVAWVNYAPMSAVTTSVSGVPGTRYVTTIGDDTGNNCIKPNQPCRTVQYAVAQALEGDKVEVAAGVYTDVLSAGQVVNVSKGIALAGGYTSTLPVWEHDPDIYTTTLHAQGGGSGVVITGPVTVTLAGFHVVNGADGVAVYAATAIISRCHVTSNTDGVHSVDGDLTLERTWVYANVGDGVKVEGGTYALINNVVAHNTGAGLQTVGSEGMVLHNTFARNTGAGAIISQTAGFTNTIFYSHTVGLSVTTGSTARLSNTIWFTSTAHQATGSTLISSTNVYSDPMFTDPDGMDYHVEVSSSAIERGEDTWLNEDIDGEPRPLLEKPDIGADEFSLVIAKYAPANGDPGQVITYTIVLRGEESGLVLTDTLDAYLSYTGTVVCTTGNCGYLAGQQAITWTGSISTEQPAYITYTAQITTWLAAGVGVVNDAEVVIYGDVRRIAPAVTTINDVTGTRYVAPALTGDDTDNSCRMDWKPCATVQQAVDHAQVGDTVKVAEGTYTGAGDNVVAIAKSLTLQGSYAAGNWTDSDPVGHPTRLDGQGSRRVVHITGTVRVTVTGFHVVSGTVAAGSGGGLYVDAATVTLAHSRVYSNAASTSGGGIYQSDGSLTITATQVYSNVTGGHGGGLYLSGADVALVGNRVYTNTAGMQGGGLRILNADSAYLERNVILDNQADDKGGGVVIQLSSGGLVTMTNNIIAVNRANNGGDGLYFAGSAEGFLRHNTVAGNAEQGLAVGNFTLHITNTILVSHAVGITTETGANVTADHTLWYGTNPYTDTSGGGSVTTTNDLTGAPSFVDPVAMDYHIKGNSAAAGAGVWAGVSTDIDGESRSSPPDIGADQYLLRASRWASSAELAPCHTVTHTLVLTNLADIPISGVRLTDTLPASVSYADIVNTITCTVGSGGYLEAQRAITWTGDVAAESSVSINYSVNVAPHLTDGAVITFTGSISDPISIFTVGPLSVTVRTITGTTHKEGQGAVSPSGEATIGEPITYTIFYTVPKGHVAYEPVVTDELPRLVENGGTISTTPALTYVVGSLSVAGASTKDEDYSADGGAITWTLNTVTATCDGPEVVTLSFNAWVLNLTDSTDGDLLTNTVTVSYTESSSTGLAHVISERQTLTLVEPGLAVTHTAAGHEHLGVGENVLVITVTNTGKATLYDVVVTDTLQGGWVVSGTTSTVFTHVIDSIGAGNTIPVIFTALVSDTIGPGVIFTATAEALGTSLPGAATYERPYTATQTLTGTTGYPDLVISKDGPAVRSPGQSIVYTIGYTNAGLVRAEDVQITDTLPLTLTGVISATSAGATVEDDGQTITWTLTAPVSRSLSGYIWITATVPTMVQAGAAWLPIQEGTVLTNTAGITATTEESNATNNDALVTTTVQLPSLSITKTAEPAVVYTGGLLTYTLTVSNAGLGDATDVVISDTAPLSTTYQSCSGGDSCGYGSGSRVVTWTLASISAGGQNPVIFAVQVDGDAISGTTIFNQTYDVTCTQGSTATGAPVGATVALLRDMSLEPPTRQQSILPGESVVYTHVLTNLGNAAATFELEVSDAPSGWTYELQPSSGLVTDLGPGAWAIVTLTVRSASGTTGQAVAAITATWQGSSVSDTVVDTTSINCVPVTGVTFDYSPKSPLIDQTITFTGTVTAGTSPFNYTWNFGDGDTGDQLVVTHDYGDDCSYTVKFTVTNCGGAFSASDEQIVIVNPYRVYMPVVLRE